VFERRQPTYSASNHILKLARRGSIAAAVASQTIANCFYIYRKAVLLFVRDDLLETVDSSPGTGSMDQTVQAGPWQVTELLRMPLRSKALHSGRGIGSSRVAATAAGKKTL
jgi:hypothetical protein